MYNNEFVIIDCHLPRKIISELRLNPPSVIFFTNLNYVEKLKDIEQSTFEELKITDKIKLDLDNVLNTYWDQLPNKRFNELSIDEFFPDINNKYSYWYVFRFSVYYEFKKRLNKHYLLNSAFSDAVKPLLFSDKETCLYFKGKTECFPVNRKKKWLRQILCVVSVFVSFLFKNNYRTLPFA